MRKEKTLKQVYRNPFYWFIETEMGLSFLPIHKAIIVIQLGYGKRVPKNKIRFT